MKKKMNITLILSSILCLVPIIMSAMFYNQLPDRVATHWDINGVANGYSSKMFAAFGIPLILLVVNLFVNFALDNDPKKENTPKALKVISKFIIPFVAIICQTAVILNAVVGSVNFGVYIFVGIGLIITIIGSYLPKCKQNYTIGIKLPWTLNNETNWDKTHKLAGYLWMAGGILMIINAFISLEWLIFAIIGILVFVPMVYSFILYKKGY